MAVAASRRGANRRGTVMRSDARRCTGDADLHGYPEVAPDLVFEIRSPSDRTRALMAKVVEYLDAGVKVVCIVDPERQTVSVHTQDELARVSTATDELTLPEVFADFRVPVRAFFA